MTYDNVLPSPCCEEKSLTVQETLRGNLDRKRLRLKSQLNDIESAIEAMDSNKEVTKLMELVLIAQRH